MRDLVLAIGMSPREWPGVLHRFAADHGGARIRITALSEDDVTGEFDVLVVDDLCPFLSPRLVERLERDGRAVVGLVDPGHAAEGRRILQRCGIDAIVRSDAPMDEILGVAALASGARDVAIERRPDHEVPVFGVSGPAGSCGKTEVAVSIARSLATIRGHVVLVDLDLAHPSLALRLGLRPHPNVRTALVARREGRTIGAEIFQRARRVGVLAGVVGSDDQPLPPVRELADLIRSIPASSVIADMGSGTALLSECRMVVGVGRADPVGFARLLRWLEVAEIAGDSLHILVNQAPADAFTRSEIEFEIRRIAEPRTVGFLPWDRSVVSAAWECTMPVSGRFHRGVGRWVARTSEMTGVGVR